MRRLNAVDQQTNFIADPSDLDVMVGVQGAWHSLPSSPKEVLFNRVASISGVARSVG
ncbi:MAG: hypothetical protein WC837_00940 [Bellilinea sp.]